MMTGKKPRTTAQRYADYKRTFPTKVNDRRCELIDKMDAGFTEEERSRPFADHPGWEAECERRERANLTDAEWAEYEECTRIVDEWGSRAPWEVDRAAAKAEQDARLDALMERLKDKAAARREGGPSS